MSYRPNRHYWIIGGSESEVYFSGTNTMVPADDPEYQAWSQPRPMGPVTDKNMPGEAATVDDLRAVLAPLFILPEWLIIAQPTFIQPGVDACTSEQLKEYTADRRWREEITGINVAGRDVATDRKSQGLTTTARAYAADNPEASIQYKIADGSFVTLTSAQMIEVADAISAHVQACFDTEANIGGQIDAGTVTTTDQIDAVFAQLASRKGRKPLKVRHWRVPFD